MPKKRRRAPGSFLSIAAPWKMLSGVPMLCSGMHGALIPLKRCNFSVVSLRCRCRFVSAVNSSGTQPLNHHDSAAHLQLLSGKESAPPSRDVFRAEILRKRFQLLPRTTITNPALIDKPMNLACNWLLRIRISYAC